MKDIFDAYTVDGILKWCHRITEVGGRKLPQNAGPKHVWSKEEDAFIGEHYGIDMSSNEIANIFGTLTGAQVNKHYWALVRASKIKERDLNGLSKVAYANRQKD